MKPRPNQIKICVDVQKIERSIRVAIAVREHVVFGVEAAVTGESELPISLHYVRNTMLDRLGVLRGLSL